MKQRFKRFLLVVPPFYGPNVGSRSVVGVGAGYLMEYLHEKGIDYQFLDMRLEENGKEEELFKKIRGYKPDLVGFQIMTYRKDIAFSLIKKVKENFDVKIIAGGPHVSSERKIALEECPSIDFGVKIEGEETLYEIIKGVAFKDIKGLIYRNEKSRAIIENEDRPFIKDLDSLPFPTFRDFDLKKYDPVIPIISSRGCPYGCIFCTIKLTMGRAFRARSPENLLKEIKYWHEKGYRNFQILDDNFTLLPERVIKFCELVNKHYKNLSFALPNGIRADKVTKELLLKLKETGFSMMAIAVESANNKVLKAVKKGETLEQIDEAVRLATGVGFDVELFFIIGNPSETEEDVRNSFKMALKYPVAEAKFYNMIPFRHTELYSWIEQDKDARFNKNHEKMLVFHEHLSNEPFFETKELSFEKRRKLLGEAQKIRTRILKRNMARKFSKLGIFGRVFADIFYFKPVHRLVEAAYQKRGSRRAIQKLMKLFRIKVRNF
ncbi:MAG: radical SAM protein [Candidatus Woesearchaeota archaeon]